MNLVAKSQMPNCLAENCEIHWCSGFSGGLEHAATTFQKRVQDINMSHLSNQAGFSLVKDFICSFLVTAVAYRTMQAHCFYSDRCPRVLMLNL